MLSKIRQTEKTHIVWYLLYVESKIAEFIKTGSRIVATRGWDCGKIGEIFVKTYTVVLEVESLLGI